MQVIPEVCLMLSISRSSKNRNCSTYSGNKKGFGLAGYGALLGIIWWLCFIFKSPEFSVVTWSSTCWLYPFKKRCFKGELMLLTISKGKCIVQIIMNLNCNLCLGLRTIAEVLCSISSYFEKHKVRLQREVLLFI